MGTFPITGSYNDKTLTNMKWEHSHNVKEFTNRKRFFTLSIYIIMA